MTSPSLMSVLVGLEVAWVHACHGIVDKQDRYHIRDCKGLTLAFIEEFISFHLMSRSHDTRRPSTGYDELMCQNAL